MSIPLVQEATKDAINTSIIAIKRNIERINMLLGLSNSEEIDTSKFATKDELQQAVTDLQPVDEVAVDNMQSVSSNAVAKCLAYSLTEQKIGGVWFDGKPIYRKVNRYEISSTSNSYFDLGLLNIPNVETIINAQVTRIILSDYGYQVLNSTVVLYNGHLYVDKAWTGNIGPCFIILEYTKTTD